SVQVKQVRSAAAVTLSSKRLTTDLISWGVVPAKSLVARAHDELALNSSFWHGVFDGDGHISLPLEPIGCRFTIGSEVLARQFATFVVSATGGALPTVTTTPSGYYRVGVHGDRAETLLREWSSAAYGLDRKIERAKLVLASRRAARSGS